MDALDKVQNRGRMVTSSAFFFQWKKDLLLFQGHHTAHGDVISGSVFLLTLSTLKPLNT